VGEGNYKYKKDDVKLFDAANKPLEIGFNEYIPENSPGAPRYYIITIRAYQDEALIGNEEIVRKVFLKLGTEQDVIEYAFKKQDRICGWTNAEYLKVKYNDILVGEINDKTSIDLQIKK